MCFFLRTTLHTKLSFRKYTTFSKLSIYGQGQGHRNNKSAQNVSFFSHVFSIVCDSIIMPQKVWGGGWGRGYIGFGLSVHVPIRPSISLFEPYHIFWTVHAARVFKFYIWIPYGKIADLHFLMSEISPFLELCPFEKIRMKFRQQDISKRIWARDLKLDQLIGDDE